MNYDSLLESERYIQKEEYIKAVQILQSIESSLDSSELIKHQEMMLKILSIYEKLKIFEREETISLEHILLKYKFGKIKEAEDLTSKYALQYNRAELHNLIGNNFDLNKNDQAIFFNLLGHAHYERDMEIALLCFDQELKLNPKSTNAHQAISELNFLQGNIDEAIDHIREVIKIDPSNTSARDNLIMMMHYTDNVSIKEIYQEALQYLAKCFPERQHIKFQLNNYQTLNLSPDRNHLRVGFVSGDLRKHALYYWLKDFLKDDNFKSLEIFLYHNTIEDKYSEEYKSQVINWRNISKNSDEEAFKLIQEDRIDVLIDLAGHTRFNRLGIFALKPAPLQITWLGQSGPMGVPQIDYMLVSENQVKTNEERFFTEKVEYLKGFLAPYSFTEQEAHRNLKKEIPFFKNTYISFGCANGLSKINKKVLMTWSEILKAVPNSKLFLKNRSLNDSSVRENIISFFENENINRERIVIEGFEERESYLNFYKQLDLALDPFPVGGGTTSLDSLSMGVPILSLYGKHLGHRFGACMNYCLDINKLVCFNEKEYIQRAIELAQNPEELQKIRSKIIENFRNSELCNIKNFVSKFETVILKLWKQEALRWSSREIDSQKKLFFKLCDEYHQAETDKDLNKLKEISKQLQISFPEQDTSWFYSSLVSVKEGEVEKAIAELKKALEIAPENKAYNNNLVMLSHYSSELNRTEMLEFAKNYYDNFVKNFIKESKVNFDFSDLINKFKQGHTKIRIGFLSGDIKMHPIFFWISSLIGFNSSKRFDIYIYANNSENDFAEAIRKQCHKLTYVENLSAKELAEKIHEDQIHILIDISGHTAFNKLEALALKAAPLQMTWLGQSGPMGIPEIDYMIVDPHLVKDHETHFFTEKVCRMPNLFAPYPAQAYSNLVINRSLARDDGKIVFGSFNHSIKINNRVLEVWSEILNRVPNSLLFIKNMSIEMADYQTGLIKFFKLRNIEESRIILECRTDKSHYLESFSKIDIALDPFPFGGGTTTHETLMMSVPLVAIFGDRPAHRGSAAILYASGLKDLVALNEEEYKDKIINLAQNPELILEYKKTIREIYLNSAAADMQSFAKSFFESIEELCQQRLLSLK